MVIANAVAALTKLLAELEARASMIWILRELLGDSNPTVVAAVAALTKLLAELKARASMIWIIGEYAERNDNAWS